VQEGQARLARWRESGFGDIDQVFE
jgi:hypothetical protein